MQENKLIIYKDIKNILDQSIFDNKTRILITFTYAILSGNKSSIYIYVKIAIRYGVIYRNFLKIISRIVRDMKFLYSIIELLGIIDDNFGVDKK